MKNQILSMESGMYTGENADGQTAIILRQVGFGYTIKTENCKGIFECEDFDELGNIECQYIER